MADRAKVILSILPPHAALDMAWAVQGFGGIFADVNAIAPATAREIARMISDGGGSYVDGGIIGPPQATASSARLCCPDPRRGEVRELFRAGPLGAQVINGSTTAASAVKMAYAAWTKGSGALLLTARALARAEGVEETLLAEWALSQPGLAARSAGSRPGRQRQGLALGRRDGGDRREHGRGQACPTGSTRPRLRYSAAPRTPGPRRHRPTTSFGRS